MNSNNTNFHFIFKPEPATLTTSNSSRETRLKSIFIVRREESLSPAFNAFQNYSPTIFNGFRDIILFLNGVSEDQLPEAIIGYYEEELINDITYLIRFLQRKDPLAFIPLILIESPHHKDNNHTIKMIPGVDSLLSSNITSDEIQNEIRLIKKLKRFKSKNYKDVYALKGPGLSSRKKSISYIIKRGMDLFVASMLLCLTAPLMLVIALIIKLESKGPIFYASYRSGTGYQIFKFLKFRSMVQNADEKLSILSGRNQYGNPNEKEAVFFKISDDPRVTKFGKFLRNSSLDELPQLFNVIKGDMSIVGNRPLPLYEAKTLTTDRYAERFHAPAGITGLWQITKRGQKEMSAEERIALDIHYARNHSFLYDIKIILNTPKALTQKDDV